MRILTGKVISTKMQKTATVAVERFVIHPLYKKRIKKVKKYHVHDSFGVKEGENVKFVACKPYSKLKKWKIIGQQAVVQEKVHIKKGQVKNGTV